MAYLDPTSSAREPVEFPDNHHVYPATPTIVRNSVGHIDIPRMREGGMNAIFFSIRIDGHSMGQLAMQKALDQIDAVHPKRAEIF